MTDAQKPVFNTPVDSENKATSLKCLFRLNTPHSIAFHLSWLSFMACFFSTFAPAALITHISKPVGQGGISLTADDKSNSNIASVIAAIMGRIALGRFIDNYGPRYAYIIILLGTAIPVFCMSAVQSAAGFIALRFFIGFALCTIVSCQYWCTIMFNVGIVGTVNAFSGGWGNLGGGLTLVIMPLFQEGIQSMNSLTLEQSWRYSFFLPAAFQVFCAALIFFFGQDTPLGNYGYLKKTGQMKVKAGDGWPAWKCAMGNYRTWVLHAIYAVCFGVELAVDNVIHTYFEYVFHLTHVTAGAIGAVSGLLNLFSRPSGGILSDYVGNKYGMRMRLWALYVCTTLGGVFLIAFGKYNPASGIGGAIVLMVLFSIFYEQACGATYASAPFISNRSYGLVGGLVASGGNVGASIWQATVFKLPPGAKTLGGNAFVNMGIIVMCVAVVLFFMEYPMWGGMLRGPRPEATEHGYYLAEYTEEERAMGMHEKAMKFADECSVHGGSKHGGSNFGSKHGANNAGTVAIKASAETV